MKTAISLPDDLFAEIERVARRLGKSRSALYRAAISEFLSRHDPDEITESMNRVAEQLDTRPDRFATEAARRALERTEW